MKDKKNSSREEVIIYRLCEMIKKVKELKAEEENGKINIKNLAKNDKYIRICGESYRAVSLNQESPLCGYAQYGVKTIKTIIEKHFNNKIHKVEKNVLEKKEERRIQSLLIKRALMNNRSLNAALNISIFDEFLFALDEVSFGDNKHPKIVRCDILAVGSEKGNFFPVLIELKSVRHQKELIYQLDNFLKEIKENIKVKFVELLETCTGKKINQDEKIRKVIIWPYPKKEMYNTSSKFKEKEILEIKYKLEDKKDINSIEFLK